MAGKWMMLASLGLLAAGVHAGTLILKDGDSISGVQIISIEGDRLVIEKDNARKTISMNKLKGYYYTDVKNGGNFEEDVADYKISITDVRMPTYTTEKKKGHSSSSSSSKQENCVISYNLSRDNAKPNVYRVKEPYFYIYLLLSGDKEHGERAVYSFYYPTKYAKPKGKSSSKGGYDRAAILSQLSNFDRPTIDLAHVENKMSGREVTIQFKSLPHRKILAYHIEVYGTSDLILEKNWHDFDGGHGEWWKTY